VGHYENSVILEHKKLSILLGFAAIITDCTCQRESLGVCIYGDGRVVWADWVDLVWVV
jgi:hypothetical protein